MAVFHNPRGIPFPNPTKHGLPEGTRLVWGTEGNDVFIFDGPLRGNPVVVVGLGGDDTFNSALDVNASRYYGGYLRAEEWIEFDMAKLTGVGKPGEAPPHHRDGTNFIHIGEGDHAKSSGVQHVILHGGHYSKPAQMWAQDDFIYVSGTEDVTAWSVTGTRRDFDGKGYTSQLQWVDVVGDTPNNPVTDEQWVRIRGTNGGHEINRDGTDGYQPIWVDHDRASGPTEREMQMFVDNWDVII